LIAKIDTPISAALLQCNSRETCVGVDMKAMLTAAAMILAVSAVAQVAHAEGPRASSEHNWPGIANPEGSVGYNYPVFQYQPQSGSAPHYVWQEGYDHGGKWHAHWALVQ
jgi:hypothetical protein